METETNALLQRFREQEFVGQCQFHSISIETLDLHLVGCALLFVVMFAWANLFDVRAFGMAPSFDCGQAQRALNT